jgi:hypothetical protein
MRSARSRLALACVAAWSISCQGEPSTVATVIDALVVLPDAQLPACGPDVTADDLGLEIVAQGLEQPVWAGAPAGDPRLFILERPGRIRVVVDGALFPTPVAEIAVDLDHNELGLLGMAFHPEWASSRRFYVFYSELDTRDTIIAEYTMSAGDPNVADPSERRVLTIPVDNGYHNAGAMAFGPDGYLYIAVGDDGYNDRVQDATFLTGKLLRIDVDLGVGNQPVDSDGDELADYAIPATNPFAGAKSERAEIWATGFRNPWRFSFDRLTGTMYIADVGRKLREEVSIVTPTDGRGANFGWPIREGTPCHNPDDPFDDSFGPCEVPAPEIRPAIELTRSDSTCIIGGHVYRGQCMPGLHGTYFYSDNTLNTFRTLRWIDGGVDGEANITESITTTLAPPFVTSFGEDAAGELYVVSYAAMASTTGGFVAKIVPRR